MLSSPQSVTKLTKRALQRLSRREFCRLLATAVPAHGTRSKNCVFFPLKWEPYASEFRVANNERFARNDRRAKQKTMQTITQFWGFTIVMMMLALAFVAMPFLRHRRRVDTIGVTLSLPAFSVAMYLLVGTPQAAIVDDAPGQQEHADNSPSITSSKPAGSVASLIEGLARKLHDNPDDGKGWLLLARSYEHLNRIPEARDAYERAVALDEHDAKLEERFAVSDGGDQSMPRVSGRVALSEAAAQIVLPTDTVFIFARAVDGPPMPVAAIQRRASELPFDFVLDDGDAMSSDAALSLFDRVIVSARVSRSGAASAALLGLEAHSDTITVADAVHLTLKIAQAGPQ